MNDCRVALRSRRLASSLLSQATGPGIAEPGMADGLCVGRRRGGTHGSLLTWSMTALGWSPKSSTSTVARRSTMQRRARIGLHGVSLSGSQRALFLDSMWHVHEVNGEAQERQQQT